ncbi:hypothetical protein BDD12DRAFT_802530 [Trichophaea hybrida]|nr:hypothetical protein BDD12DRAFT_802530 [Trichophaea hybrida]
MSKKGGMKQQAVEKDKKKMEAPPNNNAPGDGWFRGGVTRRMSEPVVVIASSAERKCDGEVGELQEIKGSHYSSLCLGSKWRGEKDKVWPNEMCVSGYARMPHRLICLQPSKKSNFCIAVSYWPNNHKQYTRWLEKQQSGRAQSLKDQLKAFNEMLTSKNGLEVINPGTGEMLLLRMDETGLITSEEVYMRFHLHVLPGSTYQAVFRSGRRLLQQGEIS